jgi:hypothetical protein
MKVSRNTFFLLLIGVIALSGVSACSTQTESSDVHLNMTSMDMLPAEVQSAPVIVQASYQFASANSKLMENIPCYCGCGNLGHTSNYSCYVESQDDKGNFRWDSHALGCSICVDITQDVMRLLKDGKSPQEIRASIDATYSRYGPSNIP